MKETCYIYDKVYFQYENEEALEEEQSILSSADATPDNIDRYLNKESQENINQKDSLEDEKESLENEEMEGMNIMTTPTCATGLDPNCAECCAIFTNSEKRAAFGYQLESAACECHDICVEDVRDICVENRVLRYCIPCNPDGTAGCRGGMLPDGPPTVENVRVLCAAETLSPMTRCDRINNEVEFEVLLRYSGINCVVVVTPKDSFSCKWYEFARFPSGQFYPNTQTGLNQFRNELAIIDGSCKVIIIENVRVGEEGNDCILYITYKVIDKLWKHENLLISAIKPYAPNITVCQEFEQGHKIGPCTNSGPCSGL